MTHAVAAVAAASGRFLPPLPAIPFAWNPNNTGPLYFLIVLTAGVVIPSLRYEYLCGTNIVPICCA